MVLFQILPFGGIVTHKFFCNLFPFYLLNDLAQRLTPGLF